MTAVASTVFRVICFPHNGKIVTVDQLAFHHPELTSTTSTIPLVGNSLDNLESVGVGLFKDSSLLGLFPFPPPDQQDNANVSPIFTVSNSLETTSPAEHAP